jgi:O-antigen/teichoic acid export membrane protein
LLAAAGAGMLATTFSGVIASVLQALRRFRILIVMQTVTIVLTIALTGLLLLRNQLHVLPALLVGAITTVVAGGIGWWRLTPVWRRALRGGAIRGPESRRLLGFSKWLGLSAILAILAAQLDLLLLNRWTPPAVTGYYALAANLAAKADVVNQTMGLILLPTASALTGRRMFVDYLRRSLGRSLLLALLIVAGMPFASPLILLLYGHAYAPALGVFYALLGIVLFDLVVNPCLLLAYPMGMPRMIAASDGARVMTLLVAGALLIPLSGMYGAVLARLLSKIAGALVLGGTIAARLRAAEPARSDAQAPPAL